MRIIRRVGTHRQIGNRLLGAQVRLFKARKTPFGRLDVARRQRSQVTHGLVRSGLTFDQPLKKSLDIRIHSLIVSVQ